MQDLDERPIRSEPAALDAASAALLAEVDHRVKNNLQLIASMILLQCRRTEDAAAQAALKSVLERVGAVATAHRRLFQGDPHRFEVAEFIRDLAGDLAAAAGRDDIEIALDLEPIAIPAASAAAFALATSELLGNALKHAFPDGRRGRIAVTLADGDDSATLTIADDGVGLDGTPPGFGLTIARLLAQQLHAELDIAAGEPGVRATLRVPMTRGRTG